MRNRTTKTPEEVIRNIDWKLLREQKMWLLTKADSGSDKAEGIVNLLDAIQDCAVDVLGVDEKLVFGPGFGGSPVAQAARGT